MSVFLGFDYGTKRIGVAVGDSLTQSARALKTISPDWSNVDAMIEQWQPTACVVGLPLTEDGGSQKATRRALDFARNLAARSKLKVHTEDERHSTISAESTMRDQAHESRAARKESQKAGLDAVAASIILEQWLRNQDVGQKTD